MSPTGATPGLFPKTIFFSPDLTRSNPNDASFSVQNKSIYTVMYLPIKELLKSSISATLN